MSGLLERFLVGGRPLSSLSDQKISEAAHYFAQAGQVDPAVACSLLSPWTSGKILAELGPQSCFSDIVMAKLKFLPPSSFKRLSEVLGADVCRLCMERNINEFARIAYSVRIKTIVDILGLPVDKVTSLLVDMISHEKLMAEIDDVLEIVVFSKVDEAELTSSILERNYRVLEALKEKVC